MLDHYTGRIVSSGREFIIPSIFIPCDYGRHMSINLETGLWRCFKTNNAGNFISLYAKTKQISYAKAEAELYFQDLMLEQEEEKPKVRPFLDDTNSDLSIPMSAIHLGFEPETKVETLAQEYIYSRKLYDENNDERFTFYLSKEEKFKDRLIIPFIRNGILIFFHARTLLDVKPKYLGSHLPRNANMQAVLYPFDTEKSTVVVCEGAVDAISLQLQGINATACNTNQLSKDQIDLLRAWGGEIIIGFDNDKAGRRGVKCFEEDRKYKRMKKFKVCHPPKNFKDWNEAHQVDFDLSSYINKNTFDYTWDYEVMRALD